MSSSSQMEKLRQKQRKQISLQSQRNFDPFSHLDLHLIRVETIPLT